MQKGFRLPGVHGFADLLPGAFLQPCRQQEGAQCFVAFFIFTPDDSQDQLMAEHERVVFSEQDVPDGLQGSGVMPIQLCRQNAGVVEVFIAGVIAILRRCIAGQDIREFCIVEIQKREGVQKPYAVSCKRSVAVRTETASEPPGGHLVLVHLIQCIVEIILPCLPHADIYQIRELFPVQFAQCAVFAII